MLGIPPQAVHDRAHAALAVLAPAQARGLDAAQREEIGEYLLGQQGDAGARLRTRTLLASSQAAGEWARALAPQLEALAPGTLPEIPPPAGTHEAAEHGGAGARGRLPALGSGVRAGFGAGARAAQLAGRRRAAPGGDRRRRRRRDRARHRRRIIQIKNNVHDEHDRRLETESRRTHNDAPAGPREPQHGDGPDPLRKRQESVLHPGRTHPGEHRQRLLRGVALQLAEQRARAQQEPAGRGEPQAGRRRAAAQQRGRLPRNPPDPRDEHAAHPARAGRPARRCSGSRRSARPAACRGS